MAEEDAEKKQEEPKEQQEPKEAKTSKAGLKQWIILGAVVLVCAGAGFFIGGLFTGPAASQAAEQDQTTQDTDLNTDDSEPDSGETWFYNLPGVVSNLNEAGITRYVRTVLTIEMTSGISEIDGEKLFKVKLPILTNWLTIYLASLSVEDVRGDKNLRRIQSQILDAFNEKLFPDQKPKIKRILFKEFAVQ